MNASLAFKQIRTAIGQVSLSASDKGISSLSFRSFTSVVGAAFRRPNGRGNRAPTDCAKRWLQSAEMALRRYFKGDVHAFKKIPLDISGTAFQRKVWSVLKQIPRGKTLTYGEVARRVGRPKAYRAVGTACGKNPIALIIPCHRVVASGNSLGGYAGGLRIKRNLLGREGVLKDA